MKVMPASMAARMIPMLSFSSGRFGLSGGAGAALAVRGENKYGCYKLNFNRYR
jgi:hypothetical protein